MMWLTLRSREGHKLDVAPTDTTYKQWSGSKQLCKLCQNLPPPATGLAKFDWKVVAHWATQV